MDDLSYEYELSVRATRAAKFENIRTLADLAAYGWRPLMRLPNVGRRTIEEFRQLLRENGLQFVDEGTWRAFDSSEKKRQKMPDGYAGRWKSEARHG
jgi:DNA-directed RNA polymerase alpha subunit